MLRLILILISSIFLCSSSSTKRSPIVIMSKKLIMNNIMNQVTYDGGVSVHFEKYDLVTTKMIINSFLKGDKVTVHSIEFPKELKIVSKDLTEVINLPNAIFSPETTILTSEGNIVVEKNDQLFSTTSMEIKLGKSSGFDQLR